jgi:tetratricopeptide (TPR) repeat protein
MKRYILLVICVLCLFLSAGAQQSSHPLDSALKYRNLKQYKKALGFYEQGIAAGNKGNYTYYHASQCACQCGESEKAVTYAKLSFADFADFYNYKYFETDTLNACFNILPEAKELFAGMKLKFDAWERETNTYIANINDTTKRINRSMLLDTTGVKKIVKSKSAGATMKWIRNFNTYPPPPVKDNWALYHIIVRDTVTVPFLVYIPKDYNPAIKHFLYVYLHGAVSNRSAFSVKSQVPKWEAGVLKKPLSDNAIIIYAFAYKKLNWLQHQEAFEAIEKEVAFTRSLYNIDDNRVYIGGHSDGARGAFWFAVNKPTTFAGFLGMCYFPTVYTGNTTLGNMRNGHPFFGISAKDDALFPVGVVNDIYNYTKAIGGNWENTVMTGDHSLPADSPDSTFFLYNKLFKQVRNIFPKYIAWETDDVRNGRCDWLEITQLDTTAEKAAWHLDQNPTVTRADGKTGKYVLNKKRSGAVQATIDGNTVRIQRSRVKELVVYISPEMADLKKPFKIYVNDKLVYDKIVAADKDVMLQEFFKTADRSLMIVNKIKLVI